MHKFWLKAWLKINQSAVLLSVFNIGKRYLKWALLIICLILLVVNYYALVQILETCLVSRLDAFLEARHYYFSLNDPINFILEIAIPASPVIKYVIHLKEKDAGEALKMFYNRITIFQLFILSLLLPMLLYVQNVFYGNLLKYKDK